MDLDPLCSPKPTTENGLRWLFLSKLFFFLFEKLDITLIVVSACCSENGNCLRTTRRLRST